MSQDTVFVALAQGAFESATGWIMIGLAVVFVAVLAALVVLLVELRKLSHGWSKFVAATTEDAEPLLRHAASAARNLDRAAEAVRAEVTRATGAVAGIAGGLDDAADHLRKRLADLTALLDLIQSEAEEAVLDGAAKLRLLRRGVSLLHRAEKRSAEAETSGGGASETSGGGAPETSGSGVPADGDDGRAADGDSPGAGGGEHASNRDVAGDDGR